MYPGLIYFREISARSREIGGSGLLPSLCELIRDRVIFQLSSIDDEKMVDSYIIHSILFIQINGNICTPKNQIFQTDKIFWQVVYTPESEY